MEEWFPEDWHLIFLVVEKIVTRGFVKLKRKLPKRKL
jgi:hypothetical protein